MYPLSDGKYVVSYFDPVRNKRVQKNFEEELKATLYLNSLKSPVEKSNELNYLKTASTETAVRVFLEKVPNSYFSSSKKLIREFIDFFSTYGVPRLTEKSLQSFFTHLKQESNAADRSLLVAKSRLQGFFKFLIANGAIKESPLDGIKFNRGAPFTRKPIIFDENQILEFIKKAKLHSPILFYPIFLLISETAVKTADILNMQWKDINFKTGTVIFNRSTELQERSYTLSQSFLESLKKIDRVNEHVFTNLQGQPLKKYILGRELKKFQREAGLDTKWNLLDLRTSYGFNFLKNGGGMEALKKIMGHTKVATTADIFGRHQKLSSILNDPAAVQGTRVVTRSANEF